MEVHRWFDHSKRSANLLKESCSREKPKKIKEAETFETRIGLGSLRQGLELLADGDPCPTWLVVLGATQEAVPWVKS